MKNWIGNSNSVFKTLSATNHSDTDREENDYYATDPKALELLFEYEKFQNVLEPACGEGHLSETLIKHHIKVSSSDIINRNYGITKDFFNYKKWNGDIVTNPPYKYALEFVEHALKITPKGSKVAMFLKIQFLESKKRRKLFIDKPPTKIYISSGRLLCAKNGDFEHVKKNGGSAVAYAWYIWEKGFYGDTIIKWFN
mgnify:CR=1 FL=1